MRTYRGVEGEGALALEHPVSGLGHSDGGHVRDQQLAEVCSHVGIPTPRSTVQGSHRSRAPSETRFAIFKVANQHYIPPAIGGREEAGCKGTAAAGA